jgi:hypothetical protein
VGGRWGEIGRPERVCVRWGERKTERGGRESVRGRKRGRVEKYRVRGRGDRERETKSGVEREREEGGEMEGDIEGGLDRERGA